MTPDFKHSRRSWGPGLLGTAVMSAALVSGLSGCAGFWDEVTSRNFEFKNLYSNPDPMLVLRDSPDAARRAQALAQLREPSQHGGTAETHETYVQILTKTALEDREPLCRLGAIRALGAYKDGRAAKALEEVYLQRLPFTPDMNTVVRQQALSSLVQTGHPDARHLLVRVARQPSGANESSFTDRQQTQDERLTAIRGLSRYTTYDSFETLVHILETEKDVALRGRAHESLQTASGKRLPQDGKVWRQLLENPSAPLPQEGGVFDTVMFWKSQPAATPAPQAQPEPSSSSNVFTRMMFWKKPGEPEGTKQTQQTQPQQP